MGRDDSPTFHQMNNTKVGHFPPAKRLGLITHAVIILVLAGISTWGFLNITRASVGPMFVSYLLAALLAFAPIPFFGYRAYASCALTTTLTAIALPSCGDCASKIFR